MTTPRRKRFNVGVVKIPYARRDVAHAVITSDDDRGYRNIMGADTPDHDAKFPVGADTAYTVELTDAEAERFAAASNCRYLEEDGPAYPHRNVGRPTGAPNIPTLATLAYMRTRYVDLRRWHGRDVRVAVLDQGTTQAVRDVMGFTLVARAVHSGVNLGNRELYVPEYGHGCLVAPNAVPAGGLLLDGVIADEEGAGPFSAIAAGITWAVDNGAKVINCSFGASVGTPPQVVLDACTYAQTNGGVQIVFSAGNDNVADLASPSSASRTNINVHSSIAFDEATDARALFSNHHADGSGCGPGVDVTSLDIYGHPVLWSGTSASAPHMAQLMARALTGATFTPTQVGAAFKNNCRNAGWTPDEQGHGVYDLQRALASLGAVPSAASTAGAATVSHVDTRGGANLSTNYLINTPTGAQPDDLRIVFLVAAANALLVPPPGWRVLADSRYRANYEAGAGQTVGPTRMYVLAKPIQADEPDPTSIGFGSTWFSAIAAITVRAAGGLDSERLVPVTRYGTGGTITTVPVLPATTNDLLICVFAQRQANAPTGTLSLPAGLTQQGFIRPSTGTTGYPLLVATAQLTSAARTAAFTSTSNDATGTWVSCALTVPAADPAVATVVQSEPAGAAGAFLPYYVGA